MSDTTAYEQEEVVTQSRILTEGECELMDDRKSPTNEAPVLFSRANDEEEGTSEHEHEPQVKMEVDPEEIGNLVSVRLETFDNDLTFAFQEDSFQDGADEPPLSAFRKDNGNASSSKEALQDADKGADDADPTGQSTSKSQAEVELNSAVLEIQEGMSYLQASRKYDIPQNVIEKRHREEFMLPKPKSVDSGEKRSFSCDICNRSFRKKYYLKMHILTHTGEKPYECPHCQKKFLRPYDLKLHIHIHTGDKPFPCLECGHRFSKRATLQIHLGTHIKKEEKCLKCSECGKDFKKKYDLDQHLRIHTGETPFQCQYCHKRFRQLGNLHNHTLIHKGERPYECFLCDKKFTLNGHLKRHMRTHTGEKPFECPVCQQRFTCRESVKKHSYRHTGEKPFECTYCPKAYVRREHLKRHMLVHL